MADEQHKKAIIENSKALRELTKSMSKSQAGGGTPSEEKQKSEVTGIKAVDSKIEDIKSAFSNNNTIKFFKDPVGQLGGGIKSVLSPFTELGESFKDGFGKLGSFFSGKNKVSKHDKMVLKELKAINKGIKGGFSNMTQQGFALNNEAVLSEAIGQVVGREFIQHTGFGESVGFLTKIQTTMSLLPQAIMGKGAQVIKNKLDPLLGKLGKFSGIANFFKKDAKDDKGLPEGFAQLFAQSASKNEKDSKFHDESTGLFGDIKLGFGHLINATNNMSNVIRESVGLDPIELSNATASALEASDADKDQVEREARKDDKLFQIGQNEQLLLALEHASEKFGLKNVKESIKGTSFSIIDYFKRMLAGAGTAAVGGAVGVGAGIAGFFKAIGSGFMFLGANLPMFAKGAAAIALMGASFIPFAGALYLINEALEGFTGKKLGVFAGALGILGAAIAGFGLAMSSGVGTVIIAGGITALALAGAALIPFGYAMKLAGSGLESAAVLFSELGEVGWDKVSQAAPAMKDLAVAFRDLAFGGIIEKITGGGFGGFVQNLKDFGTESSAIVALAAAMKTLQTSVKPFQNMQFTTNIEDMLDSVVSYGKKLDGGLFDINTKKATEGLGLFLGKITEHLNYNEGRGALMDSMSNLLDRSVAAQSAFSSNNSAAMTGGMQSAGFGGAMNMPVIVNQGATVTNSNPVQHITQDVHLNNRTMEFFLNSKKAQ